MDAACLKGDWDVVFSEDADNNLEGVFVYHIRKYRGFTVLLMPAQTFYNGIYILPSVATKTTTRISREVKIIEKLLTQLPKYDLFYQQFSPRVTNALSFLWKDYKLATRYTYILDVSSKTEDQLWNGLKTKVRNKIRKAKDICRIEEIDFDTFWQNCKTSFDSKNQAIPFNKEILKNVYEKFHSNNQCQINACVDNDSGEILAATFLSSDTHYTYYIAGYFNQERKESGALSYLLWHNISHTKTKFFDFEGSMIQKVEYFFRAFGGELTPHYKVWKIQSPLLRFILKFKKLDFLDW